mgnify:CR=1 FL=1
MDAETMQFSDITLTKKEKKLLQELVENNTVQLTEKAELAAIRLERYGLAVIGDACGSNIYWENHKPVKYSILKTADITERGFLYGRYLLRHRKERLNMLMFGFMSSALASVVSGLAVYLLCRLFGL